MKYGIAFCCDDNYIIPACVTIESLLSNNRNIAKDIVFYTFSNSINEKSIEMMNSVITRYESRLQLLPIPNELKNLVDSIPIYVNHISSAAYYRLFLPYLLDSVSSCLYIDCDILVRGSILPIFKTVMDNVCVAAVKDDGSTYYAERINVETYCNSGVLMMNFDKIRATRTMEQFNKELNTIAKNNILLMGDQDIINLLYKDSMAILPDTYNYQRHLKKIRTLVKERTGYRNSVIVHYITKDKPWKPTHFFPYSSEYYSYLKKYLSKPKKIVFWAGKPFGVVIHTIEYCYYDILHLARKIKRKIKKKAI